MIVTLGYSHKKKDFPNEKKKHDSRCKKKNFGENVLLSLSLSLSNFNVFSLITNKISEEKITTSLHP